MSSTSEHFTDALMRAREIALKLTGKGLPSSPLETEASREEKPLNAEHPSIALAKAALASGQSLSPDGAVQVCVAPRALKTTVEFVVPGFKVGLIIGKNGDTLKRLERMSDCRITFSPLTTPNPADMPERKVFVTGLPDDTEHCKRLVLEKINEGPPVIIAAGSEPPPMPPGSVVPVQLPNGVMLQVPIHRDEKGTVLGMEHLFVPNNKVGLIIGKGGETIKEIQECSGARIYIAPDASMTSGFSAERFIAVSGTEDAIEMSKQMLEDVLEGRPLMPGMSDVGKITVTLTMPDEVIGMVIGKRGDYFKWMMAETRCRLSVDPPTSDGRPTRSIIITGPPEGVAYAQALIHDKVAGIAQLDASGTVYTAVPSSSGSNQYTATGYPSASGDGYAAQYAASTASANFQSMSQEQLERCLKYYEDYYISAGLDASMARSAALHAMAAAGIPVSPTLSDPLESPNAASSQQTQ